MHEAAHAQTPVDPAASSLPAAPVAAGTHGFTAAGPAGEALGAELLAVYAGAVRASGGFPDVKISTLRGALSPENAGMLDQTLRALWHEGRVILSLGDWSLASEETRASAVGLDGERYLLVRFENPVGEPLSD